MNFSMMEPGQSVVYFKGRTISTSDCKERREAWKLYMNGYADLTQRRAKVTVTAYTAGGAISYEADGFEYIITKRRERLCDKKLMLTQRYYSHICPTEKW